MLSFWDTDLFTMESPSKLVWEGATGPLAAMELIVSDDYRLIQDSTWDNGTFSMEFSAHLTNGKEIQITIRIMNLSDTSQLAPRPEVHFSGRDPRYWFGGSDNYVTYFDRDGEQFLSFSPKHDIYRGFDVAGAVVARPTFERTLSPGAAHTYQWRAALLSDAEHVLSSVRDTDYLQYRALEEGEVIGFQFPDGVIESSTITVRDVYPTMVLLAPRGIHEATFHGPHGTTTIKIGWAPTLKSLVHDALQGTLPADLRAWFLSWQALRTPDLQRLPELEAAVQEALVQPTAFAVAAAANSVAELGRPMLRLACEGLLTIANARRLSPGTHLGALRVYGQALAANFPLTSEIEKLWSGRSQSLEVRLMTPDLDVAKDVLNLCWRVGMTLPGQEYRPSGRDLALLRTALDTHPELEHREDYGAMQWTHKMGERWLRCFARPHDLAWLLW